jgi:hypothetical protein
VFTPATLELALTTSKLDSDSRGLVLLVLTPEWATSICDAERELGPVGVGVVVDSAPGAEEGGSRSLAEVLRVVVDVEG